MDLDLTQLSDQLSEKLKETSNMTRNLACKILERVREFKANFSGWDSVSQWGGAFQARGEENAGNESVGKKVYHRQPRRSASASGKPKKSSSKKPASKGRTKRMK